MTEKNITQNIETKQLILITSFGTFIEWVDFSIYAFSAVKIASSFVQQYSPIITWLAFGCAYVSRPIGAIIFGYIGDTFGRANSMFYSMLCMAFSMIGIHFLPTYDQIGSTAIILLYILRFIQGLGLSGEQQNATIFLLEQYKEKNVNSLATFINFSNGLGLLTGSAISILITNSPDNMLWRKIFLLLGIITFISSIYNRYVCEKSNVFKLYDSNKILYWDNLKEDLFNYNPSKILKYLEVCSIAISVGIYFYICNIWWSNYLVEYFNESPKLLKTISSIGIAIVAIISIIIGKIADNFTDKQQGSKQMMRIGLCAAIISCPIILHFCKGPYVWMACIFYGIPYGIYSPFATKRCYEITSDSKCKSTVIALLWQVSSVIASGFSPLIATIVLKSFGLAWISLLISTSLSICYALITFNKQ